MAPGKATSMAQVPSQACGGDRSQGKAPGGWGGLGFGVWALTPRMGMLGCRAPRSTQSPKCRVQVFWKAGEGLEKQNDIQVWEECLVHSITSSFNSQRRMLGMGLKQITQRYSEYHQASLLVLRTRVLTWIIHSFLDFWCSNKLLWCLRAQVWMWATGILGNATWGSFLNALTQTEVVRPDKGVALCS